MSPIYFVNGSFVKKENAVIHVNDIGLLRGYAVFDYFKTYFGEPFHIDDHLRRLQTSALLIGLDIPYSSEKMKNICRELLQKNNFTESNLRVVVTGGVGLDSKTKGNPGFIITCEPRVNLDEMFYTEGIRIKTVSGKRELFQSKTTNYVRAIDFISEFKELGFSEYLYVCDNMIYECTSSNIYIIKNGQLMTTEEGILKGVTRKVILEIVAENMPISIRDISFDEALGADEIFISSTEREIMPVIMIDQTEIGSKRVGKYTKKLINLFKDYVNSKEWIK